MGPGGKGLTNLETYFSGERGSVGMTLNGLIFLWESMRRLFGERVEWSLGSWPGCFLVRSRRRFSIASMKKIPA